MTAQSIVCGTCSAPVAYGRLSCPSCGELLASVARARRPSSTAASSSSRRRRTAAVPNDVGPAPAVAPVVGAVGGQLALDGAGRDVDAPLPWADALDPALPWADAVDGPAVELEQRPGWEHDADLDARPIELADDRSATAGNAWAVASASMTGPATPSYMPRPTYPRAAAAAPPLAEPPLAEPAPAPPIDPPGAYVPPLPVSAMPAGPPAPARAWAGYVATDADASSATGRAKGAIDRTIDPSRIAEFVGSVSIAGAALAAVGFLLPWASVMIGATGSQYFDRWGLAGPGHIVVVIGILAVLALSIVRNPIPTWIRTGIGGLAVGSLLLGLTWPYLLGPLDAAPGVLIDAIGAVALIGAGVLALVTDRHAEVDKAV
jgi:hypothetical protein